jgi:molecular chaperone GrpE
MPKHQRELTVVESQDAAPAEEAAVDRAAAEAEALASRTEIEQLKGERDQLLDRLARLQAEFENARKRAERERVEYRDYATGSVVEQFLPVSTTSSWRSSPKARPSNCARAWS